MRTAQHLRQLVLPGLAALAATGLLAQPAFAGSVAGSGIQFATQSVAASSGGGTVEIGIVSGTYVQGTPVVYTSNTIAAVAAAPFTITFTLPTGVTFTDNPAATGGGAAFAAPMTQVSGGVGQNFISFSGNTTGAAGQGTVSLGAFGLSGATALATSNTSSFSIRASVSSSIPALNDAGATTQLAQSFSAITFRTVSSQATPLQIDVGSPSLGSQFLQAGTDSAVGDQGAVRFHAHTNYANAADTALYTPAVSSNVLLTGSYGGVGSAFLLAGVSPQAGSGSASGCPATAPGSAVTGTISGNTISFAGVSLPTTGLPLYYEVCLNSSLTAGSGVLAPNPSTTVAVSASGATLSGSATNLDAYTYNGTVAQTLFSANSSVYPRYVLITNNTANSQNVVVSVQPWDGSAAGLTTETVAANNTVELAVTDLLTASGVTLPASGRATLLFLDKGTPCFGGNGIGGGGFTCSISVAQVMQNPNGTVTPLQ